MGYYKRKSRATYLHKSGFEDTAAELFKDNGIKAEYEAEKLKYVIESNYTPDFKITNSDGTTTYIETKGYFDADSVKKMMHVKRANPELDIRMWFMKDAKIPGRKKMKYSDWCDKYGYPYHIGKEFPKHWFGTNNKECK